MHVEVSKELLVWLHIYSEEYVYLSAFWENKNLQSKPKKKISNLVKTEHKNLNSHLKKSIPFMKKSH